MRLTHPDSQQVIDVLDGSEGPYLANGWRPVTKPKSGSAHRPAQDTHPVKGD